MVANCSNVMNKARQPPPGVMPKGRPPSASSLDAISPVPTDRGILVPAPKITDSYKHVSVSQKLFVLGLGLCPSRSEGSLCCTAVVSDSSASIFSSFWTQSRTRPSDWPSPFPFHASEKEMGTHRSVPAWRTPGTAPKLGQQGLWAPL